MANTGGWFTARKTTKAARKTIIDLLKPALEFDDAGMRASALGMIAFSIRTRWPMGSPPTSTASALSGIAVALAMVRDPQTDKALRLDRSDRVLVQRGLASLGKDVGAADGVFGQRTRAALRSWQVDAGFKATGHLTREQADRLIAAGRRAAAVTEAQRLKEFCAEVPQSALCRDL